MSFKEEIKTIIDNNPILSELYYGDNNSFKSLFTPILNNDSNLNLTNLLIIMSFQCQLYDITLDNIARFGGKDLLKKCSEDIKSMLSDDIAS